MLKIITWFFTSLGILTFVALSGFAFVWVNDYGAWRTTTIALYELYKNPPNLSQFSSLPAIPPTVTAPLPSGEVGITVPAPSAGETEPGVESPPVPAIPTVPDRSTLSFTPAQIECFREKLGSERVDEIYETGVEPTPAELLAGMSCL